MVATWNGRPFFFLFSTICFPTRGTEELFLTCPVPRYGGHLERMGVFVLSSTIRFPTRGTEKLFLACPVPRYDGHLERETVFYLV